MYLEKETQVSIQPNPRNISAVVIFLSLLIIWSTVPIMSNIFPTRETIDHLLKSLAFSQKPNSLQSRFLYFLIILLKLAFLSLLSNLYSSSMNCESFSLYKSSFVSFHPFFLWKERRLIVVLLLGFSRLSSIG